MASIQQFKASSLQKMNAAKTLLDRASFPLEAAYLSSVALECCLKVRIMKKNQIKETNRIPQGHQLFDLFNTAKGHNFEVLLQYSGETKAQTRIWSRITHSDRPYSLRYSEEKLNHTQSQEEFGFVKQLVAKMESEQ